MSRYSIALCEGQLIVGWDDGVGAFFLQLFAGSEHDEDGPIGWKPRLSITEVERYMQKLGSPLPSLLRRVLIAEQTKSPVAYEPGDPVLLELFVAAPGVVRQVDPERSDGTVLVEADPANPISVHLFPQPRWAFHDSLTPDLSSVGVE